MTQHTDTIARNTNGSINTAHYVQVGRQVRSDAAHRSLAAFKSWILSVLAMAPKSKRQGLPTRLPMRNDRRLVPAGRRFRSGWRTADTAIGAGVFGQPEDMRANG